MSLNVEILEQSFEKVKPHANEFAASFYDNLFKLYPEVMPLFAKTDMPIQQKKLLSSLILVVENLRNPDALAPVLHALGARHISYGAIPQYYQPVGEALLMTFEQYLHEDWTSEVKQAWLDAFTAITSLMLKGAGVEDRPIGVELQIDADTEQLTTEELDQTNEVPQVEVVEPTLLEIVEEIPAESPKLPIEILEKSFEKIKIYANEFPASFYENLFQAYPEMKPLFVNIDMVTQQKKLLNSLVLIVESLRNPEALEPILNSLGARHISYGAIPKYYRPIGEALLTTLEQYLQNDWNSEVKKAWQDTFREITALMLKGTEQAAAKVTQIENTAIAPKPISVVQESLNITKASPSVNKKIQQESIIIESSVEQQKKPLILIQLDGEALKEIIKSYTANYRQIQAKIAEQPLTELIKQVPQKFVDTFWDAPTWLIAIISTVVFTVIIVGVDENSWMGKALGGAETISLVLALVLFIKESPDRRKQFHYQAWSTIDSAHSVKVSYARILALQDLNEDGVSLRGLDAPNAELVDIKLSHANLSKANLQECDLSNANLSYANLDNANLVQTKLSGANLSHAKLGFANLDQANLSSVNLSNANLICTNLSNANLSGANLSGASLSGANLSGAYLTGANLKNAKVSNFELSSAFLEGAIMPDGSRYKSSV